MQANTPPPTLSPQHVAYDIALTLIDRINPRTVAQLVEAFGGVSPLLDVSDNELRSSELDKHFVERLICGRRGKLDQAYAIYDQCTRSGVQIIPQGHPNYPSLLHACSDAPHLIYVRGQLPPNNFKYLAVVGTRQATPEGHKACNNILQELAQITDNLSIVSGLAFGIDRAAHTAALNNNLHTIAVMAGWVDDIVPPSNYGLARRIVDTGGAVISEMPPETIIQRPSFICRNRIIAGMAQATLVVQSGLSGGSMATADMACGYDREVFTTIGENNEHFAGNHALIKSNKAQLVQSAADITTSLNWETKKSKTPPDPAQLPENLLNIFAVIPDTTPVTIDQIAQQTNATIAQVSVMMTQLEIHGFIQTVKGRMYQKTKF